MRLHEYLHEELSRLPVRFNRAFESGGEAGALVYLRKQLSMLELVLGGDAPPAWFDPPGSVGDERWDALINSAILDVLVGAWLPTQPLPQPWFPYAEVGEERAPVIAATPLALAPANIFIRREDLRWQRPTSAPRE